MSREIDCCYSMLHKRGTGDSMVAVRPDAKSSCLSYRRRKTSHLLETLLGRLPVDDTPDSLEVLGLSVLVLKTAHR